MIDFINNSTFPSREVFERLYTSMLTRDLCSVEHCYGDLTHPDVITRLWIISCKLTENAKKFNLTSILDPAEIVRKHIIDSVLPIAILSERGIRMRSLLDVGCGAGFPSLPMAAVLHTTQGEARILSMDATAKKISHIRETAAAAQIPSIEGVAARAEEVARGELREVFDVVCARAVASLPTLVELCAPFVKVGGHFAALKSHVDDEIAAAGVAAKSLGLTECDKIDYAIPGGDTRCLVIYKKTFRTPQKFPRRYAEILKKPLA